MSNTRTLRVSAFKRPIQFTITNTEMIDEAFPSWATREEDSPSPYLRLSRNTERIYGVGAVFFQENNSISQKQYIEDLRELG